MFGYSLACCYTVDVEVTAAPVLCRKFKRKLPSLLHIGINSRIYSTVPNSDCR